MPSQGKYDQTYPAKLKAIGLTLLEEFSGAKAQHKIKCDSCSYEWTGTPISKLQAHKKYGHCGCPVCNQTRRSVRYTDTRTKNIQNLKSRNIEVLTNNASLSQTHTTLTFRNNTCGHVFDSYPGNVLYRGVDCPICGIKLRANQLTQTSIDRSEEWQKTATEWNIYKSKVYSLTRQTYNQHSHTINPNNLPRGKAGVKGAYHLDHIVPIRYCFENNISAALCSHPDNLQMLHWRANVGSRDKLKENIDIPAALKKVIYGDPL